MALDYPDYPGSTGGATAESLARDQAWRARIAGRSALSVVKASTLNRQSSVREIRATTAGDGAPIPIIYGRVQKGALIGPIDYAAGVWTVCLIWCLGEIEAIDTLLINGAAPVSGVTVTHYTGTTSQTADPTLVAAIAGYADTMVASTPAGSIGIAYSVVQYSNSHYDNWPAFVAEIKGKKIGAGNLLKYSEEFGNAESWAPNNLTITGGFSAPDGTLTAQKIVTTSTAAANLPLSALGRFVISGTSLTFSIYVKKDSPAAATNTFLIRNHTTSTNLTACLIYWETMAVSSGGIISEDLGDGWRRVSLSASTGITAGDTMTVYAGQVGSVSTAGHSYYIWGAQVVAGADPGIYTKTTSAALTGPQYSEYPADHLADLLASDIYGGGWELGDHVASRAYNAETVTSEARRTCGIVLDTVQETDQWAEILRAYAACWIVRRGGTAHLIPDKAAASVQTFTAADIVEGTLRVIKQDSSNLPTVMRVRYTDTSGTEWREREAIAKRSGVDAGTVPWRESVVSMPGVTRYSQAYREAVERLNKLTLSDLTVEFETFDEALQREAGDVITLTHFVGLASKALRITEDPVQVRPGRWRIVASEYDAAAYNSSVENAPSSSDGNLPEMGAPAAVTGLTLTESNYQLQNGDYASRIKASWTASSDPFVTSYQVTVRAGGAVIYSATTRDTEATTPPVQELIAHQVDVYAMTPLYVGAAASDTITVVGKTAVPDGPPFLTGYEVASEVRLFAGKDVSDFDIQRYAYRYGLTSGDWDTATTIDEIDALTLTTRAIPAGTWRFYANSIDSIGQYGTTPAYCDIEVTLDDSAYLAHQETCTTGSTTLMVGKLETRGSSTTTYYSDGADTWTSLFGAAAMSTFTADLASYQTMAGTSEWISAAVDVGSSMTGDWLGEVTYTDHSGTATAQLGLSTDNVSYTWGNLSRKGTARYAKIRVQGTGVFSVKVPGPQVSLRVIARETNGSGTSSSSAVTTVDTGVAASDFKSISVIPISDTQYTVSVSNLDTSGATATFDVSIRNTGGSRVAVNFLWATRTV